MSAASDQAAFEQAVLGGTLAPTSIPAPVAPPPQAPIDMGEVESWGQPAAAPKQSTAARFASIMLSPALAAAGPERNQRIADAGLRLAGNNGAFGVPAAIASQVIGVPGAEQPNAAMQGLNQRSQTMLGLDTAQKPAPYTPPFTGAPTLNPNYGNIAQVGPGGSGGGSSSNGLKQKWENAQQEQLRSVAAEESLTKDLGNARTQRMAGVASLEDQNAARMQRDAEMQQQVDQTAATKHQAFMDRNVQLADEIGRAKIDPGRLLRNADNATQFTMGLGAALGGGNAMLNGNNGNTSLDRVERLVDKDIQEQIDEQSNKKASLGARQTIFGQMLAETGDERLAATQTRALMYEAMKTKLKADSDRLGIPEVSAQAELSTNLIDQKLKTMYADMSKQAYQTFLAQAAAAAAAARAAEERAWQRQKDIFEMGHKTDSLAADVYKAELAAGKDAGKEDQAAINEASKRLGDPDLVNNGELIKNMAQHVDFDKGTVQGFDTSSKVKRGIVGGLGQGLLPDNVVNRVALGKEENISRKDWAELGLVFRHKVTGSGGSEKEMNEIQKAYEGAGSDAERVEVVRRLMAVQQKLEAAGSAPLNDSQKKELARRNGRDGASPDLPSTVKFK